MRPCGSANVTLCLTAPVPSRPHRAKLPLTQAGTLSTTATSRLLQESLSRRRSTWAGRGACWRGSSTRTRCCRTSSTPRDGRPWQTVRRRCIMNTTTLVRDRTPLIANTRPQFLLRLTRPRCWARLGETGLIGATKCVVGWTKNQTSTSSRGGR